MSLHLSESQLAPLNSGANGEPTSEGYMSVGSSSESAFCEPGPVESSTGEAAASVLTYPLLLSHDKPSASSLTVSEALG